MRGPVSDSKNHPDDQEPGDFEDDELDDLEALGVDGVVAQMTGDEPPAPRRNRPAWVTAVVLAACLYPLVSMWDDFRYWLRSSEPEPLGDALELFEPGQPPPDLSNRYVTIEGTPDVQWATVLTKKSGAKVSYLRILEGGGRLFAAVPRSDGGDGSTPQYPSTFTGRVTRFGDAGAHGWIAQLYADEAVSQPYDVAGASLVDAVTAGDASLALQTEDGQRLVAQPDDRVLITTGSGDARVLLGVESFPSEKAAEAAVAALGYPYISLGKGRTDLLRYVVRIPEAKREAAKQALLAAVEGEIDPNDPKEGVTVYPLSATYTSTAGDLSVEGEALVVPYRDNTTPPGYVEKDGALVEDALADGRMRIPVSAVLSARVEKPVYVDPDGFLIEVGVDPSAELKWALLWMLVLGVAITNGVVLYGSLRRRAV